MKKITQKLCSFVLNAASMQTQSNNVRQNECKNVFNVGVCGTGPNAIYHITELQKHPNFNPLSVFSSDHDRAQDISLAYNLEPVSLEIMLGKEHIHVVDVSTTNDRHYAIALQSLEAGKNVIVEKPAAFTVEEITKLVNTAKEQKKRISVCFQKRFNESYQIMKHKIKTKEYGKFHYGFTKVIIPRPTEYYNERRSSKKRAGGGVLLYSAIHEVDLLFCLFGGIRSIDGVARNYYHDVEVEDTVSLLIEFETGKIVQLFATTSLDFKREEISHFFSFENADVLMYDDRIIEFPLETNVGKNGMVSWTNAKLVSSLKKGTYRSVIDDFLLSITDDKYSSRTALQETIQTHAIIEEFYKKRS